MSSEPAKVHQCSWDIIAPFSVICWAIVIIFGTYSYIYILNRYAEYQHCAINFERVVTFYTKPCKNRRREKCSFAMFMSSFRAIEASRLLLNKTRNTTSFFIYFVPVRHVPTNMRLIGEMISYHYVYWVKSALVRNSQKRSELTKSPRRQNVLKLTFINGSDAWQPMLQSSKASIDRMLAKK